VIRVLIADDQALVRAGFRALLAARADIEVAGEATDGAEAVAQARALRPDVVLMDIRMPGLDGIAATAAITAAAPAVRVLILTTFDLDEYVFAGLKSGASGFLLKDAPPADLITASSNPGKRASRSSRRNFISRLVPTIRVSISPDSRNFAK